jgi:two-component system nitrate/nitrite response regulator NarL
MSDEWLLAPEERGKPATGSHRLPCRSFRVSRYARAVSRRHPEGMGLRCLIVDDSAPFLRAARRLLEREGIAVVGTASSTAEALQRANELRPDLVLVDVDLGPESGFDLVRQLDRAFRSGQGEGKPAIVLISGHAEEDLEELIAESPAAGFLAKSSLSASAIQAVICDNVG